MTDQSMKQYTDEEKVQLRELYARRAIARKCIYVLSTVDKSDPRRSGALQEYNDQLNRIDQKIAAITGVIPPITIELKPAVLFPEAKGVEL